MELNERQQKIIEIVRENQPITGEQIAGRLDVTRATLRPDLTILTMAGFLDARPRVGYFFTGQTTEKLVSDQIGKLKVKDYQSVPVIVKESSSAYDAVCEMFLEDVGSLFVVDEQGLLAGVLSRKDLLRIAIGKQDLNQVPVGVFMSRMPNITCCTGNDRVIDVAELLVEREIDALPVVHPKEEGLEVVGRITKTSIARAFVELAGGKIG